MSDQRHLSKFIHAGCILAWNICPRKLHIIQKESYLALFHVLATSKAAFIVGFGVFQQDAG